MMLVFDPIRLSAGSYRVEGRLLARGGGELIELDEYAVPAALFRVRTLPAEPFRVVRVHADIEHKWL